MNQEQLRKEEKINDLIKSIRLNKSNVEFCLKHDVVNGSLMLDIKERMLKLLEWEAEREKSVSVEQAKNYTYQWLKDNNLWGCGCGLDFDDIFRLMADFANTNPIKNK